MHTQNHFTDNFPDLL